MKIISASLLVLLILVGAASADVIKPVDVRSTSQFSLGLNIENLVNGDQGPAVGLTDFGLVSAGGPGVLDDEHQIVGGPNNFGWISGCFDGGIDGADHEDPNGVCGDVFAVSSPDDQIVEFEFDGSYDLTNMHVWNDNEDGFAEDRGLDEFEIQVSPDRKGDTFTPIGTTFNLTPDDGFSNNLAQVIALDPNSAKGIRRVRLLINSNQDPNSGDYVGLSEVRFEGTLVDLDLAADADGDGMTTGLDFLIWQQSRRIDLSGNLVTLGQVETFLNTTLTATKREGDFDNNNVVTGNDLTVWEGEYGQTSFGIAVASVPEPATIALGIAALAGAIGARRRRNC